MLPRLAFLACLPTALAAQPPAPMALWLFDEPQYLNMTITDAGPDWYDLRLMGPGQLVPGRFGNCLSRTPDALGQIACFAEERHDYPEDAPVLPLGRPAVPPAKLLACLAGGDWTWEWWLRATAPAEPAACLIDAGQDAFRANLAPSGKGLEVLSAPQGVAATAPLDTVALLDGEWHHVALTWSAQSRTVAAFLDGKAQGNAPSAPRESWSRAPRRQFLPGLAGEIFASPDLTRSAGPEVSPTLDFDLGVRRGQGWSERWRGWLTAPATGPVRLGVETDTGVRITLGEALVLDGWSPDGPRDATVNLTSGDRLPLLIEYTHSGMSARLRLLWSWARHAEEIVPAAALWHTLQDQGHDPGTYRFDLALLSEQAGGNPLAGQVDEMRVSHGALYSGDFPPPGSRSRSFGPNPPAPATPSGPPLLFGPGAPEGPAALGGRKHVFIDDALLQECRGVAIRQCQPLRIETAHTEFGLGDASIVDAPDGLRLYYGGWNTSLRVATSTDGLHFQRPDFGIPEWGGQTQDMGGNAVFMLPGQASVFVDDSPAAPASERYKAAAWVMARGVYALTSPDGIHWTRNETMLLPFDCGGGSEAFYDGQRGLYACHLRHEGTLPREGRVERLAALGESRDFLRPWPFDPDPAPVPRGAFTLPALWHELPTPFVPDQSGQIYRTRALKYPWAPDVYLAFVWRYNIERQVRETELATSRDGRHWRFFGCSPAYIPVGTPFGNALTAQAAMSVFGLVRRGDEIWQYAELSTAGHSSGEQGTVRLTQRLDGFTCLQADVSGGSATTRPLTFDGDALELNTQSLGEARVAILDAAGAPIPGFTLADCEPIRADSLRHTVQWRGGSLASLRGQTISLHFQLRDAKLFAFQFVTR